MGKGRIRGLTGAVTKAPIKTTLNMAMESISGQTDKCIRASGPTGSNTDRGCPSRTTGCSVPACGRAGNACSGWTRKSGGTSDSSYNLILP